MGKRRKRRSTPSLRERLAGPMARVEALSRRVGEPYVKRRLVYALGAVGVGLVGAFAAVGALNAVYATVVIAGSLLFLVGAWPRALIGLTSVFLFTQPLVMYLGTSQFNYNKVLYSIWAISLLGLLWGARALWRREAELELTRLVWPSLAALGAMALSLVHANHVWADVQYVVLFVYFAGLGILVASLVDERRDVYWMLGALLSAAAAASIYGLLQFFGVLPGASGTMSGGTSAIISTFGNRNYLGGYLVYLYGPGLALLLFARAVWLRVAMVAVLPLLYISFVAIDSDSVWLAWLVSLATFALGVGLLRQWRATLGQWRWGLALVVVTVVAVAGLQMGQTWMAEPDGDQIAEPELSSGTPFMARALEFTQNPALIAEIRTFRSRLVDWAIGYDMFSDAPLLGVGVGDYKREWLDYKAAFYRTPFGQDLHATIGDYLPRAEQAHNEFVQIAAEMGLVGLLATLGLLGTLIVALVVRLRRRTADPDGDGSASAMLTLGLAAGVGAFLSDSLFSFPLHLPPNALALATLLGLLFSSALAGPQRRVRIRPPWTYVAVTVLVVVAIGASAFAYRDWLAERKLQVANEMLLAGNLEGLDVIQESIRLDVSPGEAYYWLGALYTYNERPTVALRYLERAQPVYNTEFSYYMLAYAHYLQGDVAETRRYIDQIQAMAPPAFIQQEAAYLDAVLTANDGDFQRAAEVFGRLLDEGYQPIKMHVNLAEVLLRLDRSDDVQSHLTRAAGMIERERSELGPDASAETGAVNPARQRLQELERLSRRIEELRAELAR